MSSRPRKSLHTLLMLWFLVFSVVPLAFITGYSLVKYEQAIDQELSQRIQGNQREIEVILEDFRSELLKQSRLHASNKSLIYYLSQNSVDKARHIANKWMKTNYIIHRLSIFGRDKRLEIALYKDSSGEVVRNSGHEGTAVFLKKEFLKKSQSTDELVLLDFRGNQGIDLIVFRKLRSSSGTLVGYLEEIIEMDKQFFINLKKRLNLEVIFFQKNDDQIVASHNDLTTYKPQFFIDQVVDDQQALFELKIQDIPYGFLVKKIQWKNETFYIATGASKQAVRSVLRNVNYAFFTVVVAIIVLLIIMSLVISRILLRPLSKLVEAIQTMNLDEGVIEVDETSETELGLLTESFNSMSRRVYSTQKELKEKINELERANLEIRETQAKLIHSGKMASLGQLVAGVAHELNNPIGFIYSNMGHLRDYSQKLMKLIYTAETKPDNLAKEKKKAEYDYLQKDLPKLIQSCEDGARRTRDIVLGLRNFSRLEDAKIKEIDVGESIDNTLRLLTGELKNRITVNKSYGKISKINCYPSQLNQVFMNILSNATQAIEGQGRIDISIQQQGSQVIISIKDSGKGMTEEVQEKIFDPFFTTKALGQGTGLGMSITYGIIQNHGGEIQVKSSFQQGTEFIVTLPVQLSKDL